jgi:DNA-binding NarL/FixJ family response regulator
MIRILLADDQPLVRAGLRALLEGESDMEVVGEAGDGDEAVALARETPADVLIGDISVSCAEVTSSGLKLIVLTAYEPEEDIFGALRAGASAFLPEDCDPIDLVRAVRIVAGGDALFAPTITRRLIAGFAERPDTTRTSPRELDWLTTREVEVMALVAAGLSNDQIGSRLIISPATARNHVSQTMRKLGVHDRAQLVVLAYESGLVVPSPMRVRA